MNRLLLLVILFNVYISNVYAQQAPAIEFSRAFGGTNYEGVTCMAETSDGGYVVAGSTSSTDGDLLGAGLHGWQGDAMVMKFSAAGALQWTKVYGGAEGDIFNSIEQTADGGFIAAGNTNSIDGDVTTSTGGWLVKLNASGVIEWQARCANLLQVARQTNDGGYITGGEDVRKFSSTGTLEWTYVTSYIINSLCLSQDGGYVVAGAAATFRGNDFRITKLSSNGVAERLPDYGGFGDDTPYSICPTTDGGYVVAGRTNSNNNGNVWGNHGGNDIWVIKLDGDLQLQWQKCMGGSGNETGWNIYEGTSRELIIACESASVNGDLVSNSGSADGWLVKLSQDGFLLWQQTMGGAEYDSFRGVFQTSDDGYMVAGFSASADGGISGFHVNPVTVPDVWLVKLGADVSEFLPLSNQSAMRNMNDNLPFSFRDGERRRIATVQANGGNPVRGNVLAEVWAGDPVPGAVSRRYQITPEHNAATSSARITLYYLQYEFNEYNQQVSLANRLPSSPTDGAGKANFRFIKHSGDLANPGPTVVIDPNDNDIVWNAVNEYWEISFDVTSFSTFMAMDAASAAGALPVTFGTIEAFLKNGLLTVNWTTQKKAIMLTTWWRLQKTVSNLR
ncbi:hypothetical protein [Niabella hibiscisoli]|uniref:hypothetical protein n=1 Tax=Niabella hibiscisoli TaxID=1825928 RepID=UPI001F0F6653|nr:hypothetical protein [Niabella hibiscisoli]MCH5717729.1 hypothetical protein [Niabella hibiscisoli]